MDAHKCGEICCAFCNNQQVRLELTWNRFANTTTKDFHKSKLHRECAFKNAAAHLRADLNSSGSKLSGLDVARKEFYCILSENTIHHPSDLHCNVEKAKTDNLCKAIVTNPKIFQGVVSKPSIVSFLFAVKDVAFEI